MKGLLLCLLFAGPVRAGELPDWVARLGVRREHRAWTLTMVDSAGRRCRRPLPDAGLRRLRAFVAGIPSGDHEAALERAAREELGRRGVAPADSAWFERGEDGRERLSEAGRTGLAATAVGAPLDCREPWPRPEDYPEPLPPPITRPEERRSLSELANPDAPGFDGTRPLPRLELRYGSAPRAFANARNFESLYHGSQWLLDRAVEGLAEPRDGGGARAVRIAKGVLLDGPMAWFASHVHHELGHFELARLGGSEQTTLRRQAGPHPFGVVVHTEDGWRLDAREDQAKTAGGFSATQAAAEDIRRRLLLRRSADWSYLPLLIAYKGDLTGYILGNAVGRERRAFDPVDYRQTYASRSGRAEGAVWREMIAGAAWNALDPSALWALYGYAVKYVWNGRERVGSPVVRAGPVALAAGTGFWLGETGPKYRLSAHARVDGAGLVTLTPELGDGGQFGVEADWSGVPVTPTTRLRLNGAVWSQRPGAAPDENRPGGALGGGLDQALLGPVRAVVEGGYKSEGDSLGRPFAAGPWFELGLAVDADP